MATRTGRVEKRIRLEVPMEISSLQKLDPTDPAEKTTAENVSARGVRVLTKHAWSPQERLLVTSLTSPIGNERSMPARVVYCQPLAEGVFGVGLQFEKGKATTLRQSFQPGSGGSRDGGSGASRQTGRPFSDDSTNCGERSV